MRGSERDYDGVGGKGEGRIVRAGEKPGGLGGRIVMKTRRSERGEKGRK